MLTVAVTGGIAMGKSTFCRASENREVTAGLACRLFDADAVVRRLLTEPEIVAMIASEFGEDILSPDGHIDRPRLRERVFNSAQQRAVLENIVHPVVRKRFADERSHAAMRHEVEIFLADIPLLYESDHAFEHDYAVVIAASVETQMRRLLGREGITESIARQIVASQMPVSEKTARADVVLWNDGAEDQFQKQIYYFYQWLKKNMQ